MKNKILLLTLLFIAGCAGKKSQDPIPAVTGNAVPSKAVLTFPAQNAVCSSGTIVSATQATIVFSWNAATNADGYEIAIKNLLTGSVSTNQTGTNVYTTNLLRGTPYSWYVVSKSNANTTTTSSDTWKFYVAGLGAVSYSPFPAALLSPSFGQIISSTTSTTLTWTGSDVDNDIAGYDVYLGTIASPPLLKSNVTDQSLSALNLTANTTYYWKVITRDLQGNTSDSGVYQFKIN